MELGARVRGRFSSGSWVGIPAFVALTGGERGIESDFLCVRRAKAARSSRWKSGRGPCRFGLVATGGLRSGDGA